MTDNVVVIRLNTGEDLLAILHNDLDGRVKVEHPHYVKFNAATGTVVMVAYCPLSDETFYELYRAEIHFLVPANNDITVKFLNMIDALEAKMAQEVIEDTAPIDRIDALLNQKNFIEGNDTKH